MPVDKPKRHVRDVDARLLHKLPRLFREVLYCDKRIRRSVVRQKLVFTLNFLGIARQVRFAPCKGKGCLARFGLLFEATYEVLVFVFIESGVEDFKG